MRRAEWIKSLPSQEELCEWYELVIDNDGCGCLILKKDRTPHLNSKKKGDYARQKMTNGYTRILHNREVYYEHKIIWKMVYGVDPTNDIDHINGIRHDNRPENLRDVLTYQNMQNKINNTEFPGIHQIANGFVVSTMSLSFCNLELAIEYRDKMEEVLLPLIREFKTRNRSAIPTKIVKQSIPISVLEQLGIKKEKIHV